LVSMVVTDPGCLEGDNWNSCLTDTGDCGVEVGEEEHIICTTVHLCRHSTNPLHGLG